jgi:hypothetical protein
MWWGEELKPLDSVQRDANPCRDRNSIADGKQTPMRKPIPYCQAHKPRPTLPNAGEGRDGADVERQTHSARRRGGGCRARAFCCDELCGLEDPLAQRSLQRDPIWHHDPGSGDRREPYFHILLGHEVFYCWTGLRSISGLSWSGRVSIASLPSLATVTNTHPEPNTRPPAALKSLISHTAETGLAGLGRQDSNLGMAESKSTCFAFDLKDHSEKSAKFDPFPINRLDAD